METGIGATGVRSANGVLVALRTGVDLIVFDFRLISLTVVLKGLILHYGANRATHQGYLR
jgi:hypothetical protein